jgi:hypothetical protein
MSTEPTAPIVGTPHRVPVGDRIAAQAARLIAGASVVNGVPRKPVTMPKYIGPDHTPSYGPPTRADVVVDLAVRRGYGGHVTDEEIAQDAADREVADGLIPAKQDGAPC